ncbi:MAG TPA: hypothetical protein VK500_06420, partial [Nitrospiraceae bacterium]|nr:hypothetical protein [Nitrospiraceae bacterium]
MLARWAQRETIPATPLGDLLNSCGIACRKRGWVGLEEIEWDQDLEDGAASNCPIFVLVIIKLLR